MCKAKLFVISGSLLFFTCVSFSARAQPQVSFPVNVTGSSDKAMVTATNQAPKGAGVNGSAPAGVGVQGNGLTGVSGQGSNKGTGVYGYAEDGIGLNGYGGDGGTGVHGASGYIGVSGVGSIGVYAETSNPSGVALRARNPGRLAGIFEGTVQIQGELNAQNINAQKLNVQSCVGCNPPSDRNLKSNFSAVNPRFILNRLASVPIQTWNYNFESKDVRHLGPVAQDFRAAFGLGDGDKTINAVDANGVAFAAIQGLYQMIQEKDRKIDQLENRLTKLERRSAGIRVKRSARRR